MKFEIGDIVILVKGNFTDEASNPAFDGVCGRVYGRIIYFNGSSTFPIGVRWDNTKTNVYKPKHLKKVMMLVTSFKRWREYNE